MKFFESHFEDYLASHDKISLHPKIDENIMIFPELFKNLGNIIIYGPKGVGKYTCALNIIRRYSDSDLKYEKKLVIETTKGEQVLKISDIHFEVDLSLLGCNSKSLWNEIYTNICDVVSARQSRTGIIMCKYFHDIHGELLETFYSYMQTESNSSINLKFVFITEELSFIPDNIRNRCKIFRIPRPSRAQYNRCLTEKISRDIPLEEIANIKNITAGVKQLMRPYQVICDSILEIITSTDKVKYAELRDKLYDIFIYNLDITDCILYMVEKLEMRLSPQDCSAVLDRYQKTLKLYNNNYRPIYHLESFVFYLITKLHGFTESM